MQLLKNITQCLVKSNSGDLGIICLTSLVQKSRVDRILIHSEEFIGNNPLGHLGLIIP